MFNPNEIRISVGGTLSRRGLFRIEGSAIRPAEVSTANGKVVYELYDYYYMQGNPLGLIAVEMVSDDRIRVETFTCSGNNSAVFDANAVYYTR